MKAEKLLNKMHTLFDLWKNFKIFEHEKSEKHKAK